VGQVRILVEDALQGFSDFGDHLSFLLRGNAIAGDAYAYERHEESPSDLPFGMNGSALEFNVWSSLEGIKVGAGTSLVTRCNYYNPSST
jgi:hypothetical protein